ncbi:helix-turn-helix transcriptional regulator [Corallococcus exiguus]|uniref:helix-turn-helix transcriptional regulator n=1 Tax=Corallococcus exiguus TaxID=83462 RepID=UPI001493E54C|nr:AraC family transcriptional regulator [Corallococcus exiguus]NPC72981.1 AraC family transcriptional regulator [Corallococcus exiguus]NPD24724.1 AraC family transcriptional regulator [Corallococcus exiguus]
MRRPSPIERTARLLDTTAALYLKIRQREADPVYAGVEWLSAGLMYIQRGEKVLRQGDEPVHVRAGEFVWISPGTRLEVRNVPDEGGEYQAEGMLIAPELLLQADPKATPGSSRVQRLRADEVPRLVDAHHRCIEALTGTFPEGVVRARVLELIAWLRDLHIDVSASSSARLGMKRLVSRDPSRAWTLTEVARKLAMSEDTLHRRLTGEATTFSKLLTEVRMDHAVSLLWTTDLPVGHVAIEAGYTSASRFATRFHERFGVLPSKLRAKRPQER